MRRQRSGAAFLLAAVLALPLAAQDKGKSEEKAARPAKPAAAQKKSAEPKKHAKPSVPEVPVGFTLPEGPRVTLAEAIATTLERDPRLETSRQELRRLKGVVQEATGHFDPVLTAAPSLVRQKTYLTQSALQGEISKRQFLADSSANLSRIATQIASGLTDDKGVPFPDCKGAQYFVNGFPICTDSISPTDYKSYQLLQDAQDATAGKTTTDKLSEAINKSVRSRLTNVLALIRKVFLPALNTQLVNIGDLPTASENDTLTFDLRVMDPFRNGMVIGPVLLMQGTRNAFSDKPESPAYGGTGVPTLYQVLLGLSADIPLMRSSGSDSVAAEERSAKLEVEAQVEAVAQAASDAVLNTTIAYWNLSASQEMQKLLSKGVAEQRRIGELSRALVEGDEIPRSELSKVDAQTADTEAAALQAAREVAVQRVELALAMGIDIARIEEAPLAADPLPSLADVSIPDAKGMEQLIANLKELRGDLRASQKRVESAKVLETAARLDLRPRLDLSIQGGWNAIWEDPTFNITKAWNPTGYGRAFGQNYVGPSVLVSLALQLPWGNNGQKGKLVQAESFRSETEVTARDLERQVVNEARQLATSLPSTVREAAAREAAASESEKTVGMSYERYRAGETTLLDALLSQRAQIQAQSDLVAARQTLAQREARLRWSVGTLVPVTRKDGDVKFEVPKAH